MNGGSTTISRTATFDAARALPKGKALPLLDEVESTGDERLLAVLHRPRTMPANCPHQPLRQHAIEGRDKVVGLNPHVKETPQHVEHVVRVYRREYQVPGKRRLDGDLRGFIVPDFPHHDFVWIVPQYRSRCDVP